MASFDLGYGQGVKSELIPAGDIRSRADES
jgi:hypothetical protein